MPSLGLLCNKYCDVWVPGKSQNAISGMKENCYVTPVFYIDVFFSLDRFALSCHTRKKSLKLANVP